MARRCSATSSSCCLIRPAQAKLHVLNLKGTDGEIALRLGSENEAFGVINVGDTSALCKLCEEHPDYMVVDEKEFSGSLFANSEPERFDR